MKEKGEEEESVELGLTRGGRREEEILRLSEARKGFVWERESGGKERRKNGWMEGRILRRREREGLSEEERSGVIGGPLFSFANV